MKLRKPTTEDCKDLWAWRNHPQVRRWCLNNNEIDYGQHRKWFKDKISDNNVSIYIAENDQGQKVGQARFEIINKTSASIHVNLNPQFFSKGLGSKLIKQTSLTFMDEEPSVKEIIARIIKDNPNSLKAFKKAGYQLCADLPGQDKSIIVYKFER